MIGSEVEPQMIWKITTGKYKAVCAALDLPDDTPPDTILDLMADKLSMLDIYHRARGWVDAQVFKLDAKKKGGKQ